MAYQHTGMVAHWAQFEKVGLRVARCAAGSSGDILTCVVSCGCMFFVFGPGFRCC